MAQQISAETALPHFRQRCSELHDENILLRARGADLEQEKTAVEQRATELEKQLAEARREIDQLRGQSCIEPDALP